MAKPDSRPVTSTDRLIARHLLIGWIGLIVFLSLGIALEILHGLKADLYLDVRNATRRTMWTLAHTHGTLFSLVHLGFASTISFAGRFVGQVPTNWGGASRAFSAALLLMPAGFLLGGTWTYGGDPGPGIFLVPVGAVCLLYGAVNVAMAMAALRK